MKLFWLIILILIGATVVLVVRARSQPESSMVAITQAPEQIAAPPQDEESGKADAADLPDASALAADLMNSFRAARRERDQNDSSSTPPIAGTFAEAPAQVSGAAGTPHASGHTPPAAIPQPREYEPKPGADTRAKVVQQADGSVLVDDRFVIRGSGSESDPYQISWDLLISASETYQPRLSMNELPERVKMLSGKHVQITGHLAFPLTQMEATEALLMFNMWDGCCIGVPPSPYDAVEVKLKKAVSFASRRFFSYGTLTGVLQVDPYLVNDWLLGLYVIEDGELDFGL